MEAVTINLGGKKMIRLGEGIYLCFLNGYPLKIIYKGKNICQLYLGNEYQGTAPFD
jgi:hypothetical protein